MKTLYIYILVLAVGLCPFIDGFSQIDTSKVSIYTIFEKVRTSPSFKVIGFERISPIGARDTVVNSPALITALAQLDLPTISHIITEQTGYECLTDKDYFIIVPRDDPAKHELALCKRDILIDDLDKSSFDEVFKKIDKKNSEILLGGPLNRPDMGGGVVSVSGGKYKCYDLLNQMAIQSVAKVWTMDHMDAYNLITGKLFFPIILSSGSVSFFKR